MKNTLSKECLTLFFLLSFCFFSCKKDSDVIPGGTDTTITPGPVFDINKITDTYASISAYADREKWGPYNTHDPSIIKEGSYYYCYSTDAGYGITVPAGIQIRRSKDLVDWQFVGWAFNGLPSKGAAFITQNGGTPFESLWAPYIIKVGSEFRLYYSLSSAVPRLSVIGLATATSPLGPWTEKGPVVTSLATATIQTNAIDPTVIIDQQGQHWMYYGSAWDGIYVLKLNATTGLAATSNAKGTRIAQRGFTGNKINGNIEGPEIIYNSTLKKYYLFIAYDWLETKYNVRVGRADSPEGPFYDFNGNDMNLEQDNVPMIVAPYQFNGHSGWQGTSHCSVFEADEQFYMAHQGRPGIDKYFMVLHVRKMFWTEDGWPVVSPERYAATEQTAIANSELTGNWEQITLNYQVVPGYAEEQTSPNFQTSVSLKLNADGTINEEVSNKWSYTAPWLTLTMNSIISKLYVERGRDWENKKACLVFTGLDANGKAIWGKK